MFVTNPLSRRTASPLLRRTRLAAGTLAVSALVGTSAVAIAGNEEAGAADADMAFTAFTPAEAQRPQIVPAAIAQEQHRLAEQSAEATRVAEEAERAAAAEAEAIAAEAARPRTVRPVAGRLTSYFGSRWGTAHNGIDFGDPIGAPIFSAADGVVIEAGPASGFGLWVRILQDDGTTAVYGHMHEILVSVGQPVRAGDTIATVGNRGHSTGPHLHFEVHAPGAGPIDPHAWLGGRGVDAGVAQG